MEGPSPEAPRSAKVDALFAGELPEPVNLAPTLRLLRLLLVTSLPMNLTAFRPPPRPAPSVPQLRLF